MLEKTAVFDSHHCIDQHPGHFAVVNNLPLGALIAFSIITETVFQWPGMGLLFIQAVSFADVPVMAAYLCFIALVFVLINLSVDLLYYAVDPRLRIERLVPAH